MNDDDLFLILSLLNFLLAGAVAAVRATNKPPPPISVSYRSSVGAFGLLIFQDVLDLLNNDRIRFIVRSCVQMYVVQIILVLRCANNSGLEVNEAKRSRALSTPSDT